MININTQIKFKGINKKIIDILFIIGTVLLSIRSVVGLSQLDSAIFSLLTYLAYAFVMVRILFHGTSIRNLMLFVLFLLLGFLVYVETKNTVVLNNVIFIFGAIDINKEKIMRWNAIVIIISVTIIMLMSISGSLPIFVNDYLTFGFNNPNGLQAFIIAFTILWIYGVYNKIGMNQLFILLLVNTISAFILDSKTSYVVIIFLTIFLLIIKNPHNIGKKIQFKIEYWYLILVVIIAFCIVTCNILPPIKAIDAFTSGRFSQAASYLVRYGIKPFGSHIIELDVGYENYHWLLDCGYARLFINYGWVFGFIYVIAHFMAIRNARMSNDKKIIVAIMGFAILMTMENAAIGINFNMSLLLLSDLFLVDKNKDNKSILIYK